MIGWPLGQLVRFGDWLGGMVLRIKGIGYGWYLLRRFGSYLLALLLFLGLGAIVALIASLIWKPLGFVAGLVALVWPCARSGRSGAAPRASGRRRSRPR